MFDFFILRFPRIDQQVWRERFRAGKVFSGSAPLDLETPFTAGMVVHYFREVGREPPVRRDYRIVFHNKKLLVVDKPPHLPVIPGGSWIDHSLLMMLRKAEQEDEIVPLHRIDRLSSGLVIFSRRQASRRQYARLFQPTLLLQKEYLVVCEAPNRNFPPALFLQNHLRRSKTEWWRQEIISGLPPNSACEIRIEAQERRIALYRVKARSGRKHQLRVQLAHVGLPILGDPLYGTHPRHDTQDISTRMFLDAHLIHIGPFPPLEGRIWTSRENPDKFFEEALHATGVY